jgi:ABC-type sugar transport system permease subunit
MGTASTYAIGMLIVLLAFMVLYLARIGREKERA